MQFAEEKYSIVLKDSSLEIVDFAIEDKEEITNDVPPNPLKNPYFELDLLFRCIFQNQFQKIIDELT